MKWPELPHWLTSLGLVAPNQIERVERPVCQLVCGAPRRSLDTRRVRRLAASKWTTLARCRQAIAAQFEMAPNSCSGADVTSLLAGC